VEQEVSLIGPKMTLGTEACDLGQNDRLAEECIADGASVDREIMTESRVETDELYLIDA
jgi:hypothetical protein